MARRRFAALRQRFQHHRCGREGQHCAEENALGDRRGPAKQTGNQGHRRRGQANLQRAALQGNIPHPVEFRQGKLHPQGEQQEGHPQLSQDPNRLGIVHPAQSQRPNGQPCQQVTQQYRLSQPIGEVAPHRRGTQRRR